MEQKSSKKIEKFAVNKIQDLILRIDNADYKFNVDDTGISWDGEIFLYQGNIDKKANYDCSIKTQIKGRTKHLKKLEDKIKYEVDKRDLENYLKEDGTMYLVVLFKDIDNFKIYYADLLPYNLRKYLKEQPNSKNEIKIKLKSINDSSHFEKILRDFSINRYEQKRISEHVFEYGELSIVNGNSITFYDWNNNTFNPYSLLGTEKYAYQYDKNNNITSINCIMLMNFSELVDANIKDTDGNIFYSKLEYITGIDEEKVFFGKAFHFNQKNNTFNIEIKGTLFERIKQINFIEKFYASKGFYINDFFCHFENIPNIQNYLLYKDSYYKIRDFLAKHKINKDINLDQWENKNVKDLLVWIDAVDNKIPLERNNVKTSQIGSIKIKDLTFSIFAEKRKDGKFNIYSLWNDFEFKKYHFKYQTGNEAIYTQNLYSILNYQAYCSDDINIESMKKIISNYELTPNEENLINLQALEVIKAYDINGNKELLEYAIFLLNKIENYKNMKDIVLINKLQVQKRKRQLTLEEKSLLIDIKNNYDDLFYKISINLLIDNNEEAKILFSKLNADQQKLYKDYPISIYL